MLHKKGPRDYYRNYRAICLLCHYYMLMSAIMARRLMTTLEGHLPDTQAEFRPARGCRDNVCALNWFIQMILQEGRQAVITLFTTVRRSTRIVRCSLMRPSQRQESVPRLSRGSLRSSATQTLRWHDATLRAIRHRQRSTPGGHLLARCINRRTAPDIPDA